MKNRALVNINKITSILFAQIKRGHYISLYPKEYENKKKAPVQGTSK
jgi:hypothetical protein